MLEGAIRLGALMARTTAEREKNRLEIFQSGQLIFISIIRFTCPKPWRDRRQGSGIFKLAHGPSVCS